MRKMNPEIEAIKPLLDDKSLIHQFQQDLVSVLAKQIVEQKPTVRRVEKRIDEKIKPNMGAMYVVWLLKREKMGKGKYDGKVNYLEEKEG